MVPPASHKIPRVSWYSGAASLTQIFVYATITLFGLGFPSAHSTNPCFDLLQSTTPHNRSHTVWPLPLSLATTYGISVDFSSCGYLDVSVHQVRFQQLCIHCRIPASGWVSPFGHYRIKACCQLPDTFRRLPRPSSPLTAKASTVCAYSLDHITASCLGLHMTRGYKARIRI